MNQIKIDLERVTSDIDRNIFGGSLPVGAGGGPEKYLFINDFNRTDKDGLRMDVREVLERVKLPNIRFASGNFVSGYRWMDGIGSQNERPIRRDLSRLDGGITNNHYGVNEFIQFCRKMNIAPYLAVNCGDGDMREAADFVEYCNGTGDSAPVKLRRKHGFAEPHKVKYWGVGNEVDGPWQIGYKTPQEYARAFTEFSKVMKRVDPDIKLIASAVSRWEDQLFGGGFSQKTEWVERAQLMLEQAGDRIDYMSIHRMAHPYYDDPFETYMAFAENYNERLSTYEGLIRAVSLERGIKHAISIAVDEWILARWPAGLNMDVPISVNVDKWGVPHLPADEIDVFHRREWRINLEDALITALHLNTFIRHAYWVRMANFCIPMPQGIGINSVHPDSPLLLPAMFYPFELYSRTCGKLALDVFWHGETFSGTYKNRAYSGIRTLDVAATLDQSRKQLVVYVVNQSKEKAMETTISLATGQFTGNVHVSVVNGSDIKAENTTENPNAIGVRETVLKASGKSFTYTFEPHSVTALVCIVR